MSPSFITKKTSSSSTFKTLTNKVKGKLEKVKCRMHKTKSADDNKQVVAEPIAIDGNTPVITAKPEPVDGNNEVITEPEAAINNTQVIAEPEAADRTTQFLAEFKATIANMPKAAKTKAADDNTDVLAEFKATVANMPKRAAVDMPKPAVDNNKVVTEPTGSNQDAHETVVAVTPQQAGEDGLELAPINCCGTRNKQQKVDNKQARREARKEKWAARRTAFKRNAKKVGDVILLSTAVVGGIIFAPVILVVSILFAVGKFLVWLVVKILDLLCCGPVLVCFVCKEGMREPQPLL